MGNYFSDKRINAWRDKSGHQTMTEVLAAEKEAKTKEVSMEEAWQMVNESGGGEAGTGGNKTDKIIRLLESIERKLDGLGNIG